MINIIGGNESAHTLRLAVDATSNINVDVCFGARSYVNSEATVLNGIARLDGRQQFDKFMEAGLTIPVYTTDVEEAKEWVRKGILVWGRQWVHSRGTDIIGAGYLPDRLVPGGVRYGITRLKPKAERFNPRWLGREWWVQVVPEVIIKAEWRIHIFQGRSIGRGLKIQTSLATRIQPVRNRDNGWTLVHDAEPSGDIKNAAAQAVNAVGYNFGAVDLIELTDNNIIVLEVNSAPALRSQYTIDAYSNAIQRVGNGKWKNWRIKDFNSNVNTNTI